MSEPKGWPTGTYLPFLLEFHEAIRSGRKTMTCRTKPYGDGCDVVKSPVGDLWLRGVFKVPLGFVARNLYAQEGCESPAAFREVWERIHPKKVYNPAEWVWLHEFEVVVDA